MSKLTLKCRWQGGQTTITDLTNESTLFDLKLMAMSCTGFNIEHILLKQGYPPTPISSGDDRLLLDCGIRSGDVIIVEESSCSTVKAPSLTYKNASLPITSVSAGNSRPSHQSSGSRTIIRKVVPANNSCLFASIHYCIYGTIDQDKAWRLRKIVAEKVLADRETYTEAVLGRTPEAYAKWIKEPESWGGAIELGILCHHLNIQINVIDIQYTRSEIFGEEGNYNNKIFLLYDGIHYDPLHEVGSPPTTMFPVSDDIIDALAISYAAEQQSGRQFTDTNRFTLKCLVCGQGFVGQREAMAHAQNTDHINFGEY